MKKYILLNCLLTALLLAACNNTIDLENENWEDGSLKQIVEEKEIRTYDQERLLNKFFTIKYFHKGEIDSSNFYKVEKYYDNGQISRIENYMDKKLNGKVEDWYRNGIKALDANYVKGKLHGEYKSWFPDGKVLEQLKYDMDSVIKK